MPQSRGSIRFRATNDKERLGVHECYLLERQRGQIGSLFALRRRKGGKFQVASSIASYRLAQAIRRFDREVCATVPGPELFQTNSHTSRSGRGDQAIVLVDSTAKIPVQSTWVSAR